MKALQLFSLLFFVSVQTFVFAQETTEMDELDLVTMQVINIGTQQNTNNTAFVQQLGNQNASRIIQDHQGGQPNISIHSQTGPGQFGNSNNGYIEQGGAGLTTLLGQNGNSNSANLWAIGSNIRIEARQNGNNNSIDTYIENYTGNSRSADLRQDGNQNRIEISLRGDGFSGSAMPQQVQITQTGNNHTAVANMEPFSSPFEITQTPGMGGEGMSVNVSTSQFNFPMRR